VRTGSCRHIALVIALCGLLLVAPANPAAVYRQESVKAAFVLRFSGYVTWSGKDLPGD
jgi:hypothetical protein